MKIKSYSVRNIGSDLAIVSLLFMLPVSLFLVYGYYIMAAISCLLSLFIFIFGEASEDAYSYKRYIEREKELPIIDIKQKQLDETLNMLKKIVWKIDMIDKECHDISKINSNLKSIKREIYGKINKVKELENV